MIHRPLARLLLATPFFAVSVWAAQAPVANSPAVIVQASVDVSDQLDVIRSKIANSVPVQDVTITGRTVWDHDTLVARRLIFAPQAELVFSRRALEKRPELFVIASTVISRDIQQPGLIGWEAQDAPASRAQESAAPSGQNGVGEGAAGSPGLPGAVGLPGIAGQDGPSLFLFVLNPGNSRVQVRLEGKAGGDAAPGQSGGAGGAGAPGASASQSAFDCRRGPGYGGAGGTGGGAGPGGSGGSGGHGGVLTVLSGSRALDGIDFSAPGGRGGHGGAPGKPGSGGAGGPEGSAQLPWCRPSGRQGPPGATGKPADPGSDGATGRAGELRFVPLSDELIKNVAGELDDRNCSFFGLYCR